MQRPLVNYVLILYGFLQESFIGVVLKYGETLLVILGKIGCSWPLSEYSLPL